MNGWLLDTNVIASLIAPNGAPSVKDWVRDVDERALFISVLTLAEYDKGVAAADPANPNVPRFIALRDGVAHRFKGRILSLDDVVVRRWGEISGRVKRATAHPPPVIDTLLAATAIEFDLYFATRNTKDVALSCARIFDPWHDDPTNFPVTGR